MMKFVFHVGPHKTGSTYLQAAFASLRPQLAERGVLYPTIWGGRSHAILYDLLRSIPNPLLEKQFAELRASGQPVVLISEEGLTTLSDASVAYLRTLVGNDSEVEVVFYARSWADILPAHWKQAVKAGDTQTLPEFLHGRTANPAGSFLMNFGMRLRRFVDVFGVGAIRIVSYEAVLSERFDLFEHFAGTFLDWYDPPHLGMAPMNVSPTAAEIEVVRAINSLEKLRRGGPPDPLEALAMADAFVQHARDLSGPVLLAALAANMATAFVSEVDPAPNLLHRQLFQEFGRSMVPPNPRDVFFEPRKAEIPYVRRDYLLVPGVVEQLREIHRQLSGVAARSGARPGRSAA
jgi:hypothetical protein